MAQNEATKPLHAWYIERLCTIYSGAGFKGGGGGSQGSGRPGGHHKTEIDSTDFIETFSSLKPRKVS
jgi:hypothetical protein